VLTRYVALLGTLLPFREPLVDGFLKLPVYGYGFLRAHLARFEIAQAVSASNTEFMVGFNYRFLPNHMTTKRFIDAGARAGHSKKAGNQEKRLATVDLIKELIGLCTVAQVVLEMDYYEACLCA